MMRSWICARSLVALACAVVAVACNSDREVLIARPVAICENGFGSPANTECFFPDVCERPTGPDPDCCVERAYCQAGSLKVVQECRPFCRSCVNDRFCPRGAAICSQGLCEICPRVDQCMACPAGWQRLRRNGCETCDCAPPATCALEIGGADCLLNDTCYPGATCAEGCDNNDAGCCATGCANAGCSGPIPLGCVLAHCSLPGCSLCAADTCQCVAGAWQCSARCIAGVGVRSSCTLDALGVTNVELAPTQRGDRVP
jgi:hypothetical protein